MKIVVVGYGRVGRRVVADLVERGHEVTLIDQQAIRLEKAIEMPDVKLVQGNGIDADVQRQAGVEQADVFLAVTREDNVNLMAAQVARTLFHVPHAIARVYEPSHRQATDDPHLLTVCPTDYAVEAILKQVESLPGAPPRKETSPSPRVAVRPRPTRVTDESRYILVIGGGKVGVNLVRSLTQSGHEVALIEVDPAHAAYLSTSLDCTVIVGDGTLGPILENAGAARARVFVAVTGKDQDNLIACQLAKHVFRVPKTIARVSNPKNQEIMLRLGVDATVSSTAIIEQMIERELPTIKIKTLLNLRGAQAQINEYLLEETCPVAGQALKDISFPPDCNIIAIERNGSVIIPRGDTRLEAGDMVIALVTSAAEPELRRLLGS
ncbi:MAG TPA: NAD-binding protein [Blastocatellia bacterium]|nr:NAD-binding protein [Blastocatellia bacterium]